MSEMRLEPAGGWPRIAAVILDSLLMLPVFAIILVIIPNVQAFSIISQILVAAYFIHFEASGKQATPGKRIMKLFVATKEGARMSYQKSAFRYFMWIVFSLPYIILTASPRYAALNERLMNVTNREIMKQILAEPENQSLSMQLSISLLFYCVLGIAFYLVPMFFSKDKAALHDRVTGTRVFKNG